MKEVRWLLGCALVVSLFVLGCGGKGHASGGAAGAGAGPKAGEPCDSGRCGPGLTCETDGLFGGLCTASCSNDPSCGLLNPKAHCFGTTGGQCGISCGVDTDCPSGTHCVFLGGLGSARACELMH